MPSPRRKSPRKTVRTVRQVRDDTAARLDELGSKVALDPHGDAVAEADELLSLLDSLSDPLTQRADQARRTHAGQRERRFRHRSKE